MSDNVKDELAKVFGLADAVSWPSSPRSSRRWLADDLAEAALAFLAERGMVVLGPDSEPLDVRPAVAEAGRGWCCEECAVEFYVGERDWPRYLADACIAAAEYDHDCPRYLADACIAAAEYDHDCPIPEHREWALIQFPPSMRLAAAEVEP